MRTRKAKKKVVDKSSLKPKQLMGIEEQVEHYFTGKSVTEICKTLGISRVTFYNWQKKPEFREAVRERFEESTQHFRTSLISRYEAALQVLTYEMVKNQNVYAASKILDTIVKMTNQADVDKIKTDLESLKAADSTEKKD